MNKIQQLQTAIQEARQSGDNDTLKKLLETWDFIFDVMEYFDIEEDEYLNNQEDYDTDYLEEIEN